jgi:ethanolamine ammonia-lyase large subunit
VCAFRNARHSSRHHAKPIFSRCRLTDAATGDAVAALAPGLTPEMVAAVSKLMRNQDLIAVARRCRVVTAFRDTIGLPGRLAVRLQPNHPTDDPASIAAAILDGLLYGCGDAVIGINPATDSVQRTADLLTMLDELISRFAVPTQACVLAHLTTTLRAMDAGAPVDLVFQSIAGSEAANRSFGIDLAMLAEACAQARSLGRGTVGNDVMYFETGQGSALSAEANHGVDQQTMKRAPTASPAPSRRCWSTASSASSARSIFTTASRSSAPGWRTTSAANCSACRWGSTSAIPITPRPTRMTWITC